MSIKKDIEQFCLDCYNGNYEEVKTCSTTDCEFFSFRLKGNDYDKTVSLTALIRKHCHRCIGLDEENAESCKSEKCNLYRYRMPICY